jgi:hypothetical protein
LGSVGKKKSRRNSSQPGVSMSTLSSSESISRQSQGDQGLPTGDGDAEREGEATGLVPEEGGDMDNKGTDDAQAYDSGSMRAISGIQSANSADGRQTRSTMQSLFGISASRLQSEDISQRDKSTSSTG